MQRYLMLDDEVGVYHLHAAFWKLGPFGYRGCLYLVPRGHPFVYRVIDAAAVTVEDLLTVIAARVNTAVGARVWPPSQLPGVL
jgi:hypothetical protein